MDIELFELCKEVSKRTAWEGVGAYWMWVEDRNSYEAYNGDYGNKNNPPVALYNSDYLIEKLPKSMGDGYRTWLTVDINFENEWTAYYSDGTGVSSIYIGRDNTPLKALLRLTVVLHDAGELK